MDYTESNFRALIRQIGLTSSEYTVPPDFGPQWMSDKTQGAWVLWQHLRDQQTKSQEE